jgi:hypothetical protein
LISAAKCLGPAPFIVVEFIIPTTFNLLDYAIDSDAGFIANFGTPIMQIYSVKILIGPELNFFDPRYKYAGLCILWKKENENPESQSENKTTSSFLPDLSNTRKFIKYSLLPFWNNHMVLA